MSKTSVGILSFIAGAGVGIAGTYFYMRNWADKQIDEAIQDYKKEYKGIRHIYAGRGENVPVSEKDASESGESRKSLTEVHSSIQDGPVEIERVPYHKISEAYDKDGFLEGVHLEDPEEFGEDDVKTAEDVFAEGEHPEDGDEEDIIFIDNDAFVDDDDYAKEELVWYTRDDVLVDSVGDIIEDRFKLVGELLENIPSPSDDDLGVGALIFVRNRELEVDYEIEIVDAEHEEMV